MIININSQPVLRVLYYTVLFLHTKTMSLNPCNSRQEEVSIEIFYSEGSVVLNVFRTMLLPLCSSFFHVHRQFVGDLLLFFFISLKGAQIICGPLVIMTRLLAF